MSAFSIIGDPSRMNTTYGSIGDPPSMRSIKDPRRQLRQQFPSSSSVLEQVEQFGRDWVVPREERLSSALHLLIQTVGHFVIALFKSGLALSESFNSKTLNGASINAWTETARHLIFSVTGFIGIISPTAANAAESFINKVSQTYSETEENVKIVKENRDKDTFESEPESEDD